MGRIKEQVQTADGCKDHVILRADMNAKTDQLVHINMVDNRVEVLQLQFLYLSSYGQCVQ